MSVRAATIILVCFFALGGGLALYVAIANEDWFFHSPGVRALTGKSRRAWARLIYGVLGLAILAVCAFMTVRLFSVK